MLLQRVARMGIVIAQAGVLLAATGCGNDGSAADEAVDDTNPAEHTTGSTSTPPELGYGLRKRLQSLGPGLERTEPFLPGVLVQRFYTTRFDRMERRHCHSVRL